jgi:hypothetical protein
MASHRIRHARLDSAYWKMELKTIISPFLKNPLHHFAFLALSFIHIKNVKVGSGRSFERCSMLGNVCPDLP